MEARVRREPPPFRAALVRQTRQLSPRLLRVTLGGPELAGLDPGLPAASVRVLLPTPGTDEAVVPTWNGNEFLRPDGTRPVLRTLTPRRVDLAAHELDVDVVIHDGGPLSDWALAARPGDRAAVSGTGRGYAIDPDVRAYLLGGDETAIPAIGQLLEAIPADCRVDVRIEIAHPDARLDLPAHPGATVAWCDLVPGAPPGDALVDAVRNAPLESGQRVWVAGEAAAVQRIRKHLFEERGLPRSAAVVRGYWKDGRSGDPGSDG